MWASYPSIVFAPPSLVLESSLVDSINGVGELKFTDLADPLEWDGTLNTITGPEGAAAVTVPVSTLESLALRIEAWRTEIERTAPTPDPTFRDYEYEQEMKDNGDMIAKLKVDPMAGQIVFSFEKTTDEVTFVDFFPATTFTWDAWVKLTKIQREILDDWQFSRL